MEEQQTNHIEPKKRKRIKKFETIYEASPEIKIEITDKNILKIKELAEKHNFELYLVGGYVRDFFLKRENKDADFTVVGDAIEFAKIVAEHFHSKVVAYPRFFTAMVPVGSIEYEFVGTRKEFYLPKSRKPVVSVGTLEDDLRRRDFTINAMAVSLNKETFGKLVDIFDGYKDLQSRIIRTPLDPRATFEDDPLRMMRAIRFATQLDFEIEQATYEAIKEMKQRIEIVSQERITQELLKILDSPAPSKGFHLLYETGLLELIFPELYALAGVETIEEDGIKYFA